MSKTFSEVMIQLTAVSDLSSELKVTIGTSTTYLKGALNMLKKAASSELNDKRVNGLTNACDSIQDAIIDCLAVLTNDDVPDNIHDLIDASE